MEKLERIKEVLRKNAFLNVNGKSEWRRDSLTVRFLTNQMEIYDDVNVRGVPRYFISDIDVDLLEEILVNVYNTPL